MGEEYKLTSYADADGLQYMTILHKKTGICLGSEPIIPENIEYLTEKERQIKIRKATSQKLIKELDKLSKKMDVK